MATRDVEEMVDMGYGETSQFAAHLDRGWALLDRGDIAAARTSVQHAHEVKPDDPDAAVLQGAITLAEGDPEESVRCYDRAIELDPEYLEPYAAAAHVCLFELDDPSRALRYCNDALELDDLNPLEQLDLTLLAADCELALGTLNAARPRLGAGPHIDVLEAVLELRGKDRDPSSAIADSNPERALAADFLVYDPDGEPLEADERLERLQRVLALALRLARLRFEVGDSHGGHALAQRLTELFPTEADAWYLRSEIELRRHDLHAAVDAALRTAELDVAGASLPAWVPSPAAIHRRVHQHLQACSDAALRSLVERSDRPLSVFVRDTPPLELVAEGVDPRAPVLSLATRAADGSGEPELTGLAIYRRNLARYSREADHFEHELRHAVLEELAFFFGCDDDRRQALGLDPLAPAVDVEEDEPPEATTTSRRTSKRRESKKQTSKTTSKTSKTSKTRSKKKTKKKSSSTS